jgi:YgiT-type zinc finger domain-containing protein
MNVKRYPCEYCDTDLPQEKKIISLTRKRQGKWYIFEDVPAWICPNCGRRYFDAEVLDMMEANIKRTPDDARRIEAWEISLAPADS